MLTSHSQVSSSGIWDPNPNGYGYLRRADLSAPGYTYTSGAGGYNPYQGQGSGGFSGGGVASAPQSGGGAWLGNPISMTNAQNGSSNAPNTYGGGSLGYVAPTTQGAPHMDSYMGTVAPDQYYNASTNMGNASNPGGNTAGYTPPAYVPPPAYSPRGTDPYYQNPANIPPGSAPAPQMQSMAVDPNGSGMLYQGTGTPQFNTSAPATGGYQDASAQHYANKGGGAVGGGSVQNPSQPQGQSPINSGPVTYTPPAQVPYYSGGGASGGSASGGQQQTGWSWGPNDSAATPVYGGSTGGGVTNQGNQTYAPYIPPASGGQAPNGGTVAPSVSNGTGGTGGGATSVDGGLPPINAPTAPNINLPPVNPYGDAPTYNGYSYDPGNPQIQAAVPEVDANGNFSGMPGGQAPQYNMSPLFSQDAIQSQLNQAMGQNATIEAGTNRDNMEQFAARGLSTDSAAIGSQQNRSALNRMLADTQAQTNIPLAAQQANAQYGMQMGQLAQGDRGLSQQAWNMASQLPLAWQNLGLNAYTAGNNAQNQYGQLLNQNYQSQLGGFNAGNQANNDFHNNVNNQAQIGLGGYQAYMDSLMGYGGLANERFGLGLSEQSNNISLFNSLLSGMLGVN